MGRYYYGDIEGKFWVAVQPSDAADRFGVEGEPPPLLEYYFDQEDKQKVIDEINVIETTIGKEKLEILDKAYGNDKSCNSEDLNLTETEFRLLISEYADLLLGRQILDCLNEKGYCRFTAEL